MLVPGSKGWVNKYFNLIDKNQIAIELSIPKSLHKEAFIHAVMGRTGIIFGYPSQLLFTKQIDDSSWTVEEKLKLLLFESHLFIYKLNHGDKAIIQEEFTSALLDFYGRQSTPIYKKWFTFLLGETNDDKVEYLLKKRVDIKTNYRENKFWVNYLNNVFIYLDVILFHEFLEQKKKKAIYGYEEMAMTALTAITLASYSDGEVASLEKSIFSVFLASANLSDSKRYEAEQQFENGADLSEFVEHIQEDELFKHFLLDLSTYVIVSSHEAAPSEKEYLVSLCKILGFTDSELNRSLAQTERFILSNQEKITFLNTNSSVEKIYTNLSKRWLKILGRNRDKLAIEIQQSKELVALIRKSTSQELTKKEKELVKTQFLDIIRSMPSLAIFMLPGGAFLLPIILKVIPDLIPSAFRDNELEK